MAQVRYTEAVSLPTEYRGKSGVIPVRHEEEAVCWLWAFPRLWPWRRPVTWLYTPVVGNARWPGDLWGIDSRGDLLIIEAKRCVGQADALEDFVSFHSDGRPELSASHWREKWHRHWTAERQCSDGTSERRSGHTDGLLPRSNRRAHIGRWADLGRLARHRIDSPEYARDVIRNLDARERRADPTPYYFGLMIQTQSERLPSAERMLRSAIQLREIAGSDHVAAVAICCIGIPGENGRIQAAQMNL